MLHIIHDQQRLFLPKVVKELHLGIARAIEGKTDRIRHRRNDRINGTSGSERNEIHAIDKQVLHAYCCLNRKTSLADTSRTDQGQQAALRIADELAELLQFALTS